MVHWIRNERIRTKKARAFQYFRGGGAEEGTDGKPKTMSLCFSSKRQGQRLHLKLFQLQVCQYLGDLRFSGKHQNTVVGASVPWYIPRQRNTAVYRHTSIFAQLYKMSFIGFNITTQNYLIYIVKSFRETDT